MTEKSRFVIRTSSIEDIFWIIVMFLLGGTPFVTINTELNNISIPISIVLWLLILIKPKKRSITTTGIFSVMIIAVILTSVLSLELFSRPHFRMIAVVTIAYYLVNKYETSEIKNGFLRFMFFITVVSIIGWLLVNNTNLLAFLPEKVNINNRTYAIGIIFNYIKSVPGRNCGCFWEPGIFASYLTIAIVFASENIKENKFKIILFIVAILTAKSSAGYALLFLVIPYMLMRNNASNGIKKILSFALTITVAVLGFNMDSIILGTALSQNEWIIKLVSSNVETSSRFVAFTHNLEVFSKYPLFGAGYDYVQQNLIYCCDISTTTYLLSIYGILGIVFTLLLILGPIRNKEISVYSKILLVVIMLAILNKETHIFIALTWLIGFVMLKETEKGEMKNVII